MSNLVKALQGEIERVRQLLEIYNTISSGGFGAVMLKQDIKNAEKALASGCAVEMLKCFNALQNCE